jgi:hypothetical protein
LEGASSRNSLAAQHELAALEAQAGAVAQPELQARYEVLRRQELREHGAAAVAFCFWGRPF